jgi:hypothetical protein
MCDTSVLPASQIWVETGNWKIRRWGVHTKFCENIQLVQKFKLTSTHTELWCHKLTVFHFVEESRLRGKVPDKVLIVSCVSCHASVCCSMCSNFWISWYLYMLTYITIMAPTNALQYTKISFHVQWTAACFGQPRGHVQGHKCKGQIHLKYKMELWKYQKQLKDIITIIRTGSWKGHKYELLRIRLCWYWLVGWCTLKVSVSN